MDFSRQILSGTWITKHLFAYIESCAVSRRWIPRRLGRWYQWIF